ncbi:MAG: hypothetical protein ACI31A_07450 [Candidatus Limisoma sp.]
MSITVENYQENPFKFLKAKDTSREANAVVRNWYVARNYVIKNMHLCDHVFEPGDTGHLHVVIPNDSPRMLFIARQVALMSHFLNFIDDSPDESERRRTVITIVSHNADIKEILEREDYLCNLPKYCKFMNIDGNTTNKDSYIDIEIHITRDLPRVETDNNTILVDAAEVDAYFEEYIEVPDDHPIFRIDTRKAFYSSKVYDIGTAFTNIPAENIHCTGRYLLALNIFRYDVLSKQFVPMFDEDKFAKVRSNQLGIYSIKMDISNILCADCFEIRKKSIEKICKGREATREVWEDNNEMLSRSEHARWVLEKLILGYRPLSVEEKYHLENLHIEFKSAMKKKKYLDGLKNRDKDPAHIDICSYADLRRIKPEDLKFDSFLMLAIPLILERFG